jgi:hypothetical protein
MALILATAAIAMPAKAWAARPADTTRASTEECEDQRRSVASNDARAPKVELQKKKRRYIRM